MRKIKKITNKPKNDNHQQITYFDVKELYDAAYAEGAKERLDLTRFRELLVQAESMDHAYRVQLGLVHPFEYARAA